MAWHVYCYKHLVCQVKISLSIKGGIYEVRLNMKQFQHSLNGKMVAYCSETVFLVQVGKGKKGSYKTKYSFKGDLIKACFYYNNINIGKGYKKRLFMPSSPKKVLVKENS